MSKLRVKIFFFQIFLPSCTLDDFSGARGPLFGSQGGKIFFHGRHIFSALLRDLVGKYGIDQAESIILVGSGSGARGVGHGCDYLAEVRLSLVFQKVWEVWEVREVREVW